MYTENKAFTLAIYALVYNALSEARQPIEARVLPSYCNYDAKRTYAMTLKELTRHYGCTKAQFLSHWQLAIIALIQDKLIEVSLNAATEIAYTATRNYESFKAEHKARSLSLGGK